MKIAYSGLDIPEGKRKLEDPILKRLEEKFQPKKMVPFFVEFIQDDFEAADAILVGKNSVLDLLILDMEKLETRLGRLGDVDGDKDLLKRCLAFLEEERPLCDMNLLDGERTSLAELAPFSFKATLIVEEGFDDLNDLAWRAIDKAGMTFFYTAGKPEVRSWFIPKNSDAVTCAGKIHSDLARGFIKAEIVNIEDYDQAHNLNDARSKGLSKLVDKDYIVQHGDVLEIRFNV